MENNTLLVLKSKYPLTDSLRDEFRKQYEAETGVKILILNSGWDFVAGVTLETDAKNHN